MIGIVINAETKQIEGNSTSRIILSAQNAALPTKGGSMKLIIEIPDEIYESSKRECEETDNFIIDTITLAIGNGTPIPDNATNGDVIKAMFPNSEYEILYNTVFTEIDNGLWFTLDWWNASYQKGGKE